MTIKKLKIPLKRLMPLHFYIARENTIMLTDLQFAYLILINDIIPFIFYRYADFVGTELEQMKMVYVQHAER